MAGNLGGRTRRKATAVLGGSMADIPDSEARPGAWKAMLLPAPTEATLNKHRHEPLVVDDAVLKDTADGVPPSVIETKYDLRDGYVRDVLNRRFGSTAVMKTALTAQCLENAMALNAYAIQNLQRIHPERALIAAKVMIDGAVTLEKHNVARPATVDFAGLAALGETLSRLEKRVEGRVIS